MKNSFILVFLLLFVVSSAQNETYDEIKKITSNIQSYSPSSPDSALVEINKHLKNYSSNFAQSELYLQQSTTYGFLGKRNDALNSAIKAQEYAFRGKNYSQRARTSGLVANRYRDIELTSQAKENLKKGLFNAENISDNQEKNRVKSMLYAEYAKNLTDENDFDSASVYYTKSLEAIAKLEKSENKQFQLTSTHLGLGTTYMLSKKRDLAEQQFLKTIELAKGIQWEEYHISSAKQYLSVVYTGRGEYQKAIDILFEAEKLTKPEDPKIPELYYYLSQNYLRLGDNDNYQKYNSLYLSSKGKLSEENLSAIKETVKILDDVLKEETNDKKRIKTIAMVITILSVFIILGLILFHRKRQQKNKQLYQQIISKLELQLNEKNTATGIDFPSENQYKKPDKQPITQTDETVKTRFISDATEQELIKKLQKFEKSEKFTNKELSISLLATQLGTNTKYLSEVISKHHGKNYNTYINDLRIDFICRKIATDPEYRKFKISYLAEVSGFSTYTNFTNVFKNTTGMSPSSFLKEASLQP